MSTPRRSTRKRATDAPPASQQPPRKTGRRGKAPAAAAQPAHSVDSAGRALINDDEAALYDRQIRLWGMDAQTRLRNSSVLLLNMGALSSEIAKNLVLPGIGRLAVADAGNLEAKDLGAGFFFREESIGKNRAETALDNIRELNPRVNVEAVAKSPADLDAEFFAGFDVVVLTGGDLDTITKVNDACRAKNVKFYAANIYGLYGFAFCDLVKHEYTPVPPPQSTKPPTKVELEYAPFAVAADKRWPEGMTAKQINRQVPVALYGVRAVLEFQHKHGRLPAATDEDVKELVELCKGILAKVGLKEDLVAEGTLRGLAGQCTAELAAMAAVMGGLVAQDVLKVIGRKDAPMDNVVVFDGNDFKAKVAALK